MVLPTAFPPMTPKNSALLIIDMQHDFLDEGAPCYLPGGDSVIPTLQRVLTHFRESGSPVVHIRTLWQPDGVDRSPFTTSAELQVRGLRLGEPGADIVPDLAPIEDEYVVNKTRYSGFFQTSLESLLRSLHSTYLVFGGVATNFCVRATLQDASYRDFFPVLLSDGSTTFSEESHRNTMNEIDMGLGLCVSSDSVLSVLRGETTKLEPALAPAL
jgi:nicotinamidase-related amidase